MSETVVILGAGATKACGGPLTAEILPASLRHNHSDASRILERFLIENFHLPTVHGDRRESDYPSLPLLISLVDTAIDRKQPFGARWPLEEVDMVRKAIEQIIFNVIRDSLIDGIPPLHSNLLNAILQKTGKLPTVITLNYDVIVDNSLMKLIAQNGQFKQLPSYGTQVYPWSKRGAKLSLKEAKDKLLKLHGSLNWLYCPGCQRLNVAVSESLKSTFKQMAASSFQGRFLDDYYMSTSKMSPHQNDQTRCVECGSGLKSVMITPTHLKDYRNPHISSVWYNAERALKKANKVFFIGYSLPEDDVEVIYLLKRGLSHLNSENITVVEYSDSEVALEDHEVGRRYRSLFGKSLVWSTKGFEELVQNLTNYLN